MKNEVTVFQNEQFGQVRTIVEGNEVLFCGSDVATALGYSNPNKAIKDHCRAITKRSTPISGKMQDINFILQNDVYRLIVRSKLPEAQKFESWVFDEVLPSISKTGEYKMPAKKKSDDDLKIKKAETARINAEARKKKLDIESAKLLIQMSGDMEGEYKQVLQANATHILTGQFLLPLPEVNELTYSAGEIAERLGTTACKIGHLANTHGMKTEYYGKWFYDKAPHSNKQVETFRYYEKAVEVFRKLLEVAA